MQQQRESTNGSYGTNTPEKIIRRRATTPEHGKQRPHASGSTMPTVTFVVAPFGLDFTASHVFEFADTKIKGGKKSDSKHQRILPSLPAGRLKDRRALKLTNQVPNYSNLEPTTPNPLNLTFASAYLAVIPSGNRCVPTEAKASVR